MLAGTSNDFPTEAVDADTVQKLETLCPTKSARDAESITHMMDSHSLFSRVSNDNDRKKIRNNLLQCRMIPSLHTFIENLKFLEPCAEVLRKLFPTKHNPSIYQALWTSYTQPNELHVEYATNDTRLHPSGSVERDFEIGYQQLWLYAMRNFPAMTSATLRQGGSYSRSATPHTTANDPRILRRFGALAVSLGFCTEEAEVLAAQDGELEVAAQLVNSMAINDIAAADATERIAVILRHVQQQSSEFNAASEPTHTLFSGDDQLPPERRCGKPFDEDHEVDRDNFFLPVMFATPDQQSENVSTLYCTWEMFRGFFALHKVCFENDFLLRHANTILRRCHPSLSMRPLPPTRTHWHPSA